MRAHLQSREPCASAYLRRCATSMCQIDQADFFDSPALFPFLIPLSSLCSPLVITSSRCVFALQGSILNSYFSLSTNSKSNAYIEIFRILSCFITRQPHNCSCLFDL